MVKRKIEGKILTIGVGTTILLTSIVLALGTPNAYAQSHYQIGYDDGCAGRVVEGHHTSEYERGYADAAITTYHDQYQILGHCTYHITSVLNYGTMEDLLLQVISIGRIYATRVHR